MSEGIKIRGRKDQPSYGFEGDNIQPTLDGFRAYSIFSKITQDIENSLSGSIDSALMYGSNVNGLSAFPDCKTYEWDSDIDLLYAVDSDNIGTARNEIEEALDDTDYPVEIHIDVRECEEISETLKSIEESSSAEDIMDQSFKISYPDHYFQKSAPKRMRGFATGFIPHEEFSGEVISKIEEALLNFVKHLDDPNLMIEFMEGSRNYDDRVAEMAELNKN